MKDIINTIVNNDLLKDLVLSVAVIVAAFIFLRLIKIVSKFFHKKVAARTKNEVDDKIIAIIERTARSGIIIAGIYFFFLSLNSVFGDVFYKYLNSFLYIFLVLAIARMVNSILQVLYLWYSNKAGGELQSKLRDDFGPLLRRLIIIVTYTSAVVTILNHFHQDISSIIVSLGVGSLAIALAAKDTLANMISGFLIITDRPFRINDRIKLESGIIGDVHDIGLRSTKIKTFDNTLVIVPNQQIINEKVTNLSYPNAQIRVAVEVGAAYGSDIDKVKNILVDVCKAHPEVLDFPEPAAYFINFGDSSLDFKVTCRVAKWDRQFPVAEEIRIAIYRAFEENNIEIPFPQHVVHLPDKK